MTRAPKVILIGGPNGAGKTTAAPALLRDKLRVTEFVNADLIAQGLSGFHPGAAAIAAGRVMLERLKLLGHERLDFAFESTLASRSFAPWLEGLRREGYELHVIFLWLPDALIAVERVRTRVRRGGHHVPEQVVRRRYDRGLDNFFQLYRPLAKTWSLYDSSAPVVRLIAEGGASGQDAIADLGVWDTLRKKHGP